MPGFDVVLAELSEDPISVDRATAAVQGDKAGAWSASAEWSGTTTAAWPSAG